MDCHATPFASLKSQRDMGFEMFSKFTRNDFNCNFFADKAEDEILPCFSKANDLWYFEKEREDVPKFFFPPISSLRLDEKKELNLFAAKVVQDKDVDYSVHSQTSTKAHYTKDNNSNFEYEFGIDLQPVSSDNQQFDFGFSDSLSKPAQKDILPRLDQVFGSENTGSSNNFDNVDFNKEIDMITLAQSRTKCKVEKDLSKRSDVVNKTILRSMKRYYFTEFDSVTGFSMMPDVEKFARFNELIRNYVTEELKSIGKLNSEEIDETIFFFGSMISHIHMRRGIKVSKQRTQVNFVHKCLYNYSHKKLAQLMTHGGFKHVLRDFVNFGGIDVVINSEETLAKNQDVYKSAAEELFLSTQE